LWKTAGEADPAGKRPGMKLELPEVLHEQGGLIARRQLLRSGIDRFDVRNQVAAGRWVEVTPRVIATTTGPLSAQQRRWLAVLHAGPRSLLGGLTAAEVDGLDGWQRDEITVFVDDELSFEPVDGVRFFRSRRPFDVLRSERPGIPRVQLEAAVLLWAAYDAAPRAAHGVIAATIQQRLTTPQRLMDWIDRLRPLRRAKAFRTTVSGVAAGAHSLAELDVARMCRQFHMPLPRRQVSRVDTSGRQRWTDCEWELADGRVVVLEIDGSFHMEAAAWLDDMRRGRRLTTPRRTVVRCSAYELRHEPREVATDLIGLGIPGRVPDSAA
jgi:hypothetical protein